MFRSIVSMLAWAWASAASAQVIFAPPQRLDPYPSDYEHLDPQAIQRLRTMTVPPATVYINTASWPGYPRPLFHAPPESLGIDPNTGEPLYYRKRDLMPPEPSTIPEPTRRPFASTSPPTRPASQQAPAKGEITIIAYQPRRAAALWSR